jgi:SEFIR domain
MNDQLPRCVFISYSHDSDDHREQVLGLSERLRADGIDTILDRYVEKGEVALKHLAEAQQIAERGPMPLFLADIHLTRARMFQNRDELAKAATLIRSLGYGRRYDELADAEAAIS